MTRPAPSCAGTEPDLFFDPTRGEEAARYCATCPVVGRCFAGAVRRGEEAGWWAGEWFGPDLEDFLVVEEKAVAHLRVTIPAACGSRGKYAMGCRCDLCSQANNAYAVEYRHDGPAVTRPTTVDLQIPLFEGVPA